MRLFLGLLLYSSSLVYGQEAALNRLVDEWHKDAALADPDF
jgi:1,4-alpha-glucan branching enzyme